VDIPLWLRTITPYLANHQAGLPRPKKEKRPGPNGDCRAPNAISRHPPGTRGDSMSQGSSTLHSRWYELLYRHYGGCYHANKHDCSISPASHIPFAPYMFPVLFADSSHFVQSPATCATTDIALNTSRYTVRVLYKHNLHAQCSVTLPRLLPPPRLTRCRIRRDTLGSADLPLLVELQRKATRSRPLTIHQQFAALPITVPGPCLLSKLYISVQGYYIQHSGSGEVGIPPKIRIRALN
jgi:hypothetical protein